MLSRATWASLSGLLTAASVLACAGTYNGPASGIWAAAVQLEGCEGCRTLVALDLHESAQGFVTGVVGTHLSSNPDQSAAAWVTGWRLRDSLQLTFQRPCPPDDRVSQGFHGRLEPDGTLHGFLWGREAGVLSHNLAITLRRGAVDSLVRATFEDLRRVEC